MTRTELDRLCAAIRRLKSGSDRLDRLTAWLEAQRDSAALATTRALYQAILDKIGEGSE